MSNSEWVQSWVSEASCRGGDPDALFVTGAAQNQAKQICVGCAAKLECLADALDNGIEFGVWGGMTERERRALLRRRSDVKSWRALLLAAQAAQMQKAEVIDMRSRQVRQSRALDVAGVQRPIPRRAA